MIRGSINEDAVMQTLRSRNFSNAFFKAEVLSSKEYPYTTYSPYVIAVISVVTEIYSNTDENGDFDLNMEVFWVAKVEINTKVDPTTLGSLLELLSQ